MPWAWSSDAETLGFLRCLRIFLRGIFRRGGQQRAEHEHHQAKSQDSSDLLIHMRSSSV